MAPNNLHGIIVDCLELETLLIVQLKLCAVSFTKRPEMAFTVHIFPSTIGKVSHDNSVASRTVSPNGIPGLPVVVRHFNPVVPVPIVEGRIEPCTQPDGIEGTQLLAVSLEEPCILLGVANDR